MRFQGKRILLGVTGGIAAYKTLSLVRLLRAEGADVRVLLTHSAEIMAGRGAFEALSGHPVAENVFAPVESPEFSSVAHIELARWADLLLIAPCTAHTLAKLAAGEADTLLTLVYLATKAPRLVAPSMNCAMLDSPAVQRNIRRLAEDGATIVEASSGELACGESGKGRLPEPEELLEICFDRLSPAPTRGEVVVVAGRTEEAVDPVRMITNRSSGKTGLEIARAFRAAGWSVSAVLGPCDVAWPAWAPATRVRSALEMEAACKKAAKRADCVVMAAAVADFRPERVAGQKIKRSSAMKSLKLVPNPDVLAEISSMKKGPLTVGFALETGDLVARAREKLARKGCDLLVMNNPLNGDEAGFGKDRVEWGILSPAGAVVEPKTRSKEELAGALVRAVESLRAASTGRSSAGGAR